MCLRKEKSGNIFRVGIFLDFVRLNARTPHGGASYLRGAKRNRLDPIGVNLNGSRRVHGSSDHMWLKPSLISSCVGSGLGATSSSKADRLMMTRGGGASVA